LTLGAAPSAIRACVRPLLLDNPSADDLRNKLDLIASLGIPATDFYSLSYAREADLDNHAQVLAR
jgi:hypothetical protein